MADKQTEDILLHMICFADFEMVRRVFSHD